MGLMGLPDGTVHSCTCAAPHWDFTLQHLHVLLVPHPNPDSLAYTRMQRLTHDSERLGHLAAAVAGLQGTSGSDRSTWGSSSRSVSSRGSTSSSSTQQVVALGEKNRVLEQQVAALQQDVMAMKTKSDVQVSF